MNLNSQQKLIVIGLFLVLAAETSQKDNVKTVKIEKVEPEYTTEEKIEHTLEDHQKTIIKQKDPICYRGLVRAYGMEGLSSPSPQKLTVCPAIEYSCCTVEDQLHIIENIEKDKKKFKSRLDRQYQIIMDMLTQMKTLSQIGNRMKARLTNRRLTNCKVLLARFSFFNIDEIAEEVDKTMKEMHEFLQTSYKGFFCSICDGTKHIYFNGKYKAAVFSHEFCRQMMASSIKVLRYLHGHLAKYANFAAHYAGFCDITGKFIDEPIDPELKFEHSKAHNDIAKCWNGRNQPFWVYDCQDFCQNFSPIKLEEFFEPHIKKYMLVTRYLEKRNKELLFQESREPLLNLPDNFNPPQIKPVKVVNAERVLAETGTTGTTSTTGTTGTSSTTGTTGATNTQNPSTSPTQGQAGDQKKPDDGKKPEEEQDTPNIDYSDNGIKILLRGMEMREVIAASFSVAMSGKEGAPFDLVEYTPAFHEQGLNFYEAGKSTTSNMDLYMKIRDEVKKDQEQSQSQGVQATDDQTQTASRKARRRLKKASIVTTMIVLASTLLLF